jgi:hypothetical protein
MITITKNPCPFSLDSKNLRALRVLRGETTCFLLALSIRKALLWTENTHPEIPKTGETDAKLGVSGGVERPTGWQLLFTAP